MLVIILLSITDSSISNNRVLLGYFYFFILCYIVT